MKYVIKIGFWDVKQDKERSEFFHIKCKSQEKACSKALLQAKSKFKQLVVGVEPFFVEKIQELINGKIVVFETKTTIDVSVPDTIIQQSMQAISLHNLNRDLTMEGTVEEQDLQIAYQNLQQSHKISVLIKVTEDGQILFSKE